MLNWNWRLFFSSKEAVLEVQMSVSLCVCVCVSPKLNDWMSPFIFQTSIFNIFQTASMFSHSTHTTQPKKCSVHVHYLSNVLSMYVRFIINVEMSVTVQPLCTIVSLVNWYCVIVYTCTVNRFLLTSTINWLCLHLYSKLMLCTLVQ